MGQYNVEIGQDIEKAADIIRNGGVVIYPTETVYGIGANIFSEDALRKVFSFKKRTPEKPVSIAVSGFEMMEGLVYVSDRERRFIEKFLPGPVTIILKKKKLVPGTLTSGKDMVGIRFPDHKMAVRLIELAGVPITSTSANISGEAPPTKAEEVRIKADYILDGGECSGEPSTVVDLAALKILRKGAKYEEVAAVIEGNRNPFNS
ncbi:MAG: L-threonylcarbamoyladenylate synthase [Candidatus Methanoperedens sp.]|nr:L-threonylcarbamoyladenylate synthase [Candidatus Methanoperedens sp.]MCZ7370871.1 L-threonylcarbamoyladenylate synthase [Candidatus Methanoperedens sp.]